ncbi:MAG TPA: hypothetical protein VNK04_12655 [Gemmataceae bacterium]|nr:hypothetical protein [Gemmataceae bacterium]
MTEAEWLVCTDPAAMLGVLRTRADDRKLRLFAVACCRRFWRWLDGRPSGKAVEVAERFADGRATIAELEAARADAQADVWEFLAKAALITTREQSEILSDRFIAWLTEGAVGWIPFAARPTGRIAVRETVCRIVRDVFGNPFRPVHVDWSWLTWNDSTIRKIAQAIYDERRFEDMPLLADALEEAGCDNADILAHCRRPGEHVRGCWVIDLLLGKQ